ncbi:MAG: M20/M25/M40 family metallo-hydrolase [Sphaerochaeta sp.]
MIVVYVLSAIIALFIILLLAAVFHAVFTGRKKSEVPVPGEEALKRSEAYAEKLSEMVGVDTTSNAGVSKPEHLKEFHSVLEKLFPLVHSELEKTDIEGNLLFYWKGKSGERPLVLMSHQDVVPAEGDWIHPPFSGDIADGKVWGRGSADTKCTVMAFFQAVEELLREGYVPPQDVYLSSSCTEEWGGPGCKALVSELKRRGVKPFLVCDEGGAIIGNPIGGINGHFAMVGVFEKGNAHLRFTASGKGGHASAPPRNTPIARLAAFENSVEKKPPFRKKLSREVKAMFSTLSAYAPFGLRLLFGNIWLFAPLLKAVLPVVSSQAGAMLRTTIAFTMQSGSDAFNVLPAEAEVSANMRFIPHQGMDESIEIIKKKAESFGLETKVISASDYTKPVDINGEGFGLVRKVINRTFPGLCVCPYFMTGATDARFYQEICDNCIRFAPVVYDAEQLAGMHGLNENIGVSCLSGAVDFYRNLIGLME